MAPPPKQPYHLVTVTCPNCGEADVPVHRYDPARPRHASALHHDPVRQLSQIEYVAQKPAHRSRPRWERDEESVVVCAVAAYDGRTGTAGCGVYFGRGSRRNVEGLLAGAPSAPERDRAGAAAIEAARRVLELVAEGPLGEEVDAGRGEREIREVVVLTDSNWLVWAITEKAFEWKEEMLRAGGGGWGARGGRGDDGGVTWFEEIMRLHEAVADMERPGKVAVRFWDCREEIPFEAYELAEELWEGEAST